jgi:hypothetical protein
VGTVGANIDTAAANTNAAAIFLTNHTPSLDDPADPHASVIATIYRSVRRIGFVLPGWRGRESGDAYSMVDFDVARLRRSRSRRGGGRRETPVHQAESAHRHRAKSQANADVAAAYQRVGKADLLAGISRMYRPLDDMGEELPAESMRVQVRAREVIADVKNTLTRLFDVTATEDTANCSAKPDLTVDGVTIARDLPVTYRPRPATTVPGRGLGAGCPGRDCARPDPSSP